MFDPDFKDLYSYDLPECLVGNSPKTKRDESRLFVFDTETGQITFDSFKNIDRYLPAQSLLVINETKVVPARMHLYKKTGGKVEALLLMNLWKEGDTIVAAIVDRKIEVGDTLSTKDGQYSFSITKQDENIFYFQVNFDVSKLRECLNLYGETPVPHYIKGISLSEQELRTRYQTIFAKDAYSIAAPTASLHFTDEVFKKLEQKGVQKTTINLHVGLGTFKPLTEENFTSNRLHLERYEVSVGTQRLLQDAKGKRTSVIAVGTTTVRALESFAATHKNFGETDIFIHPPYNFALVDHMITNFHLPNSSLMMLVEAFLQHKKSPKHLVELYEVAVKENFHFYSFGDAMLIL